MIFAHFSEFLNRLNFTLTSSRPSDLPISLETLDSARLDRQLSRSEKVGSGNISRIVSRRVSHSDGIIGTEAIPATKSFTFSSFLMAKSSSESLVITTLRCFRITLLSESLSRRLTPRYFLALLQRHGFIRVFAIRDIYQTMQEADRTIGAIIHSLLDPNERSRDERK